MTATRSRVTGPHDDLEAAVSRRYDGGPFRILGPLGGGWANDVFLAEGRRGRVVVRSKHPPSDPVSIAWEHDVVARLTHELPEVIAPILARDGSTFFFHLGRATWLVPYVDAKPADRSDRAHRDAAARLLGRLQLASRDLHLTQRPGPDGLAQLRALDGRRLPAEWRERVARHQALAVELLDELDRRTTVSGLLHGDFFGGNVLVEGGAVRGLVDWEEAHVAPLVSELANGVWEFCKREETDDFDRGAAARFLDVYREAGGRVPPRDDDLLRPLIHAKRVLELLRAPTDRHVDWDYQAHNLRSADNLV